jgi:hypothetical protein
MEDSAEKRQQSRRRTLKGGKILFGNGACALDCTIRNMSDRGAMLQVAHAMSVPDAFQLYEPSRLMLHEARVVRRAKQIIGVTITASKDIADSTDPRMRRLKMMA